jgi:hypothetical protein
MHAAELQELAMVPETAQIAGFGQDGHGVDRANAGDGRHELVVREIAEPFDGPRLDLIALADQAAPFGRNKAEHADGIGLRVDRQANRPNGRGVNV